MPSAAESYSVAELELLGLTINIKSFKHLLAKMDFDYTFIIWP